MSARLPAGSPHHSTVSSVVRNAMLSINRPHQLGAQHCRRPSPALAAAAYEELRAAGASRHCHHGTPAAAPPRTGAAAGSAPIAVAAGLASVGLAGRGRRPRGQKRQLHRKVARRASTQEGAKDEGAKSSAGDAAKSSADNAAKSSAGEAVKGTASDAAKSSADKAGKNTADDAATSSAEEEQKGPTPSPAELRAELQTAPPPTGEYTALSEGQRSAVSGFFFPDTEELDMDKSMPLEDHIKEFREGAVRTAIAAVVCIGACLTFYKDIVEALEAPAQANGTLVKFVQLGPGEFFFVSLKAAVFCGFLLAFPYALFEAALYFTPALTRGERQVVGPTVLGSASLFYAGVAFAFYVLSPAALGFFLNYSQDVIESQFSIDQYFEFILSMSFATGIAFQVPILQVCLGLLNILKSEQLLSVWRYVIVGSAVVGAVLTPSTDPVTQLLLSGALCGLYFAGAGVLVAIGR